MHLYTADYRQSSVDHIVPLVRGGTNTQENKQLACVKCNTIKGDHDEPYVDVVAAKMQHTMSKLEHMAEYLDLCPGHVRGGINKHLATATWLAPEAQQVGVMKPTWTETMQYCADKISNHKG